MQWVRMIGSKTNGDQIITVLMIGVQMIGNWMNEGQMNRVWMKLEWDLFEMPLNDGVLLLHSIRSSKSCQKLLEITLTAEQWLTGTVGRTVAPESWYPWFESHPSFLLTFYPFKSVASKRRNEVKMKRLETKKKMFPTKKLPNYVNKELLVGYYFYNASFIQDKIELSLF